MILTLPVSLRRLANVGQLTETGSGNTFFWKGKPADKVREYGVGFAIKSSLSKNLLELPFGTSERIISLRLPLRQKRFIIIVSVYTPTMDSPETNILFFYDELRQLFLNIPDDDKIILLGDLNAKVGRDSQTWKCLVSHGLGKANSNGLQLLQSCNEHDLIIGNTWFRQKNKYKGTWQHPRSRLCYCSPAWSTRSAPGSNYERRWMLDRPLPCKSQNGTQNSPQSTTYQLTTCKKAWDLKVFSSSWNKEHLSECTYFYWTGWNKFMGGF